MAETSRAVSNGARAAGAGARVATNTVRKTAKLSGKAITAAVKAVSTVAMSPVIFLIVVIIAIFSFIVILVASLSQTQMQGVANISPKYGEEIVISEEDLKDALWSIEYAQADTRMMMQTLQEYKKNAIEDEVYPKVRSLASSLGVDEDLSIQNIQMMSVMLQSDDAGLKVGDNVDISGASSHQKAIITHEDDNWSPSSNGWNEGSMQRIIFSTRPISVDEEGYTRVKASDGTEDYACALGSYFGPVGNRFEIEFADGTKRTFIKADAKQDAHTVSAAGSFTLPDNELSYQDLTAYTNSEIYEGYNVGAGFAGFRPRDPGGMGRPYLSGILEVIVDESKFVSCDFGEIKSIKLIEGSFAAASGAVGKSDFMLLAMFSVSIGNLQLQYDAESGVLLTPLGMASGVVYEEVDGHKRIDVKQTLANKLEEFDGSYYKIDTQRDENGNPIIYSKGDKNYIIPTVTPISPEEYGPEIFGIDMDAPYDDGTERAKKKIALYSEGIDPGRYQTNREAITQMSLQTQNLLFGNDGLTYMPSSYGTMFYPIAAVYDPGVLTSRFADNRSNNADIMAVGGSVNHGGIDLAYPTGTPVLAASNGTVTLARSEGGYGLCIQIVAEGRGIEGFLCTYGHLSGINVTEGQKVKAGELIGYVGSTGNSTGPHLHFEVQNGETLMNPELLLGLDKFQ